MVEFVLPSLGADMEGGILRAWRVKPGQPLRKGDIIAEVETQKGILDIEIFQEGIAGKLLVAEDQKLSVGAAMLQILSKDEWSAQSAEAVEVVPAATQVVPSAHRPRISPLARRLAEERGISADSLIGSGPDGAVEARDVPQAPKPVASGMRQAIADAMSRSNREIPHYYLTARIDMREPVRRLMAMNRERPVADRILPSVLLVQAIARALRDAPDLNAWWDGNLKRQSGVHPGMAIRLPSGGLVIPALHDADQADAGQLMAALNDLITRARSGHLRSSELTDGTITITSLTSGPAVTVHGIVYPPQVALVGIGAIRDDVWIDDGALSIRPVAHLTLAADHRATDGFYGNQFLQAVTDHLHQPKS